MMSNYPQLPEYEKDPKKLIKLRQSALLLNLSISNSGIFNNELINKSKDDFDINEEYIIKPYPLKRFDALGRGSSSVVYRSVLLDSLTICAEKVIVSNDSSKKGLILRELKSLQIATDGENNSCEYIVKLLKVAPNPFDGTLSICLEMMDGGSLQDLVNEGGCQDELVLYRIMKQMLTGLEYLHSLRLLHRDLKPSNALISSKGIVKLADFGISRVMDEGNALAESFVGTLDYMAPERMIGQPYSYSSDVWSLGLTIHTLALGSYPYEIKERGFWSLLSAIQNNTICFPPSFTFSKQFHEFVSISCDKDPLKRPNSTDLLKIVSDTLNHMENIIADSMLHNSENNDDNNDNNNNEKSPKKIIKKDIKKDIKIKQTNLTKNTSIKGNANNNNNNNNTSVPSTTVKTIKSIKSIKNIKDNTINSNSTIKTEKEKNKLAINNNNNSNNTNTNTNSSISENNDKENNGIINFRKKIKKYQCKTKNISSMSARDALNLALAWRHHVTEKIGLLGDEGVPSPMKEDVYNNPAPNISISSIDALARGLNCSETLMRGAFFSVISDIKEISTSAILEDGRIRNIEELDTYGSITNKNMKKTIKHFKEEEEDDDDLFDFDIESIYESINSLNTIKTSEYDSIDEVIDDDDDIIDDNNNDNDDEYSDDDFYDYDDR